MTKKQLTDRSSSAEIAVAADQLRQAQREFDNWLKNALADPTTPREIVDGVDYGPAISFLDELNQKEIIAQKYDYVVFGEDNNVDTTQIRIGGGGFRLLVNSDDAALTSLINNPDALTTRFAPGTSLSPDTDATINFPPDPRLNIRPSTNTAAANLIDIKTYPNSDISNRFNNVNIKDIQPGAIGSLPSGANIISSAGNRIFSVNTQNFPQQSAGSARVLGQSGFGRAGDELNALDAIAEENRIFNLPGSQANNTRPVNSNITNRDDSGSVSGTGVDSSIGSPATSGNVVDLGEITIDPDRYDDSGNPLGNGADSSGSNTDVPGNDTRSNASSAIGTVDVGTLGQARAGAGSVYEINLADLELRPNVLHNYANWTYNIGLYMLTRDSFKSIVSNGNVTNPAAELKNLLFRSGGTGKKGVLGEKKDYHIENLRFTSIIGQSSFGAKSSNNFDINFEIVEPYGVAFLSELIQLALLQGIEDHFEIPYLLEIKFNGYDNNGNIIPNIPGSGPKYIPIKIINITFKITSAATIYNVTAVPYAHIPLHDLYDAFIRDSISIKGQTFNELAADLFKYLNAAEIKKAEEENRIPDSYTFEVYDPELKSSRVGFLHEKQGGVIALDRQSMNGEVHEQIQINANSTIKSAIQALANATDFGAKYNTVGQPESEQDNQNRPYRLIKIIPVVIELGDYNTSTMRYSKKIHYKIETQKMYGFLTPGMPAASAAVRGWQKEYNWIFTGKNQDVIDFEADYNIQYFNIRNVFVNDKGRVTGAISNPTPGLFDRNITRTQAGGSTFAPGIRTASNPQTDQIYNSFRGPGHQLASDHMDNVLNNPGADMLQVDLTIIGDPDWIPQDRSVLPRGISTSGDARIVANNSLATDLYDQLVMLRFKTPRDYNPEKGLMQIDTEQTFVQGLYRVITLESTFSEGKFQQVLKLLRIQNQVSNDSANIPPLTSEDIFRTDRPPTIDADPDRGKPDPGKESTVDLTGGGFKPSSSVTTNGGNLTGPQ